jgi:hypothetical protein
MRKIDPPSPKAPAGQAMQKPNVRGPTPSRKAHLALREKLNRKSKPPPPLPAKSLDKARSFRRNNLAQNEQ